MLVRISPPALVELLEHHDLVAQRHQVVGHRERRGARRRCRRPASLTVANDLMPLGYEVVMFEKLAKPGGLMRTNIPAFRLPASVLDEEIGYILDMGVDIRYDTPVDEPEGSCSTTGFDAVFVGSGAPRGKDSRFPDATTASASTSVSTGSSRSPSATSSRSASAC